MTLLFFWLANLGHSLLSRYLPFGNCELAVSETVKKVSLLQNSLYTDFAIVI